MIENGEPVIVPASTGARTTPSVVAFTKNEQAIRDAQQYAGLDQMRTEALELISKSQVLLSQTQQAKKHTFIHISSNNMSAWHEK